MSSARVKEEWGQVNTNGEKSQKEESKVLKEAFSELCCNAEPIAEVRERVQGETVVS